MKRVPLYVTRSFLPPLKDYTAILKKVWDNGILTNDGPFLRKFEKKLKEFSGSNTVLCMSNGTVTLQLALRALGIKGEVITTPFSFIATTSSILWEGSKPVYADIDPETLNIDPESIRKKITKNTKAILAVHVYGNPCNVEEIKKIAKEHKLKVIYDASHAIGIRHKGKSLFKHGDISTTSFHATKIISSAEGGAIFTDDRRTAGMLRLQRNFGYSNYRIKELGINAKMSEITAALGLASIKYLGFVIKKRRAAFRLYRKLLSANQTIRYQKFITEQNYSYYPVIFKNEKIKNRVILKLNKENIFPREYFNPSLELVFGNKISCPVAYDISRRILCLPLSPYIKNSDVKVITKIINNQI